MRVTTSDGRIYLPKEIREKFGDKFELLDRGDRLVLVPLPDEPLEALREEARDTDKTVDELKAGALAEALDEAGQ
jgi:AbrB family looped-hinge helix DNA binding protein